MTKWVLWCIILQNSAESPSWFCIIVACSVYRAYSCHQYEDLSIVLLATVPEWWVRMGFHLYLMQLYSTSHICLKCRDLIRLGDIYDSFRSFCINSVIPRNPGQDICICVGFACFIMQLEVVIFQVAIHLCPVASNLANGKMQVRALLSV